MSIKSFYNKLKKLQEDEDAPLAVQEAAEIIKEYIEENQAAELLSPKTIFDTIKEEMKPKYEKKRGYHWLHFNKMFFTYDEKGLYIDFIFPIEIIQWNNDDGSLSMSTSVWKNINKDSVKEQIHPTNSYSQCNSLKGFINRLNTMGVKVKSPLRDGDYHSTFEVEGEDFVLYSFKITKWSDTDILSVVRKAQEFRDSLDREMTYLEYEALCV